MRLAYNYTTTDFAVYAPEHEHTVLFGANTDDYGYETPPFVKYGDAWSTYDVSHWTGDDFAHFATLPPIDQSALIEGLTELLEGAR